jgi:chemotaxis protein CheC
MPVRLFGAADVATLLAISQRSLRRAGESLSALLGHGVGLRASGVSRVALHALPAVVADAAGALVGLQFRIAGEQGGAYLVVLFPMATILRMLEALLGRAVPRAEFGELERSAIQEIGNILASSFLSELGEATGQRLIPSPPRLLLEDTERVMGELHGALARLGPRVLVIQGLFEDPGHQLEGRFFILPEVDGTCTAAPA